MKTWLLFALLFIILVSGCIQTGNVQKAQFGVSEITTNTDLRIKTSTSTETKSGRNITVSFELENKRDTELSNVNLNVYDMCIFQGEDIFSKDILRANRTEFWRWEWIAGETDFPRDCEVKYRLTYENQIFTSQDIAVLPQSEFTQRQDSGTLGEISINSQSSDAPVSISVSFSESQPFVDGEEFFMYIDISNTGDGFVDQINSGDLSIEFTSNVKDISCNYYTESEGKFVSNRPLRFVNNKAPRTTCSFTATAQKPVDIQNLVITARYKYILDNSFIVKVLPK